MVQLPGQEDMRNVEYCMLSFGQKSNDKKKPIKVWKKSNNQVSLENENKNSKKMMELIDHFDKLVNELVKHLIKKISSLQLEESMKTTIPYFLKRKQIPKQFSRGQQIRTRISTVCLTGHRYVILSTNPCYMK